ncbi:MAG: hypothetical protein ACRDHW_11470 [Ktedonobacteraceae bacterium]
MLINPYKDERSLALTSALTNAGSVMPVALVVWVQPCEILFFSERNMRQQA